MDLFLVWFCTCIAPVLFCVVWMRVRGFIGGRVSIGCMPLTGPAFREARQRIEKSPDLG
jgi:hypothetical protein